MNKSFLKDKILEKGIVKNVLTSISAVDLKSEADVMKRPKAFQNAFKFLINVMKNHPASQAVIRELNLADALYELSTAKFKEKAITILAAELVGNLSNTNQKNDQQVEDHFKKAVDKKSADVKSLAA